MELGILSKVYEGENLPQALSSAQEDGFSWVHVNLETLGISKQCDAIPPETAASVRQLFSVSPVHPATLSATYNLVHPDDEVLRQSLAYMASLIRFAGAAGIENAAICTGSNHPTNMWAGYPENVSDASWQRLRTSLETLLPLCQEQRVRLLIEPEPANVVSSAERARRLLDELDTPWLGIIMDGSNLFTSAGQDMARTLTEAFDLLAGDVYVAHAKDFLAEGEEIRFVPAGMGCLDYPLYLSLLRQLPRACPLLLHGLERTEIPFCRDFLRRQLEASI